MLELRFTAEVYPWSANASWRFVTVPADQSDAIAEIVRPFRGRGFGSVRVEATIGATVWRTSVFPDRGSGCYVLPLKQAVRKAERLLDGDPATVTLRLVDL